MSMPGRLLGQGMGFPPRLDADSRVAWSVGPENIRESIRIILTTEPGERLMLPAFGAGLQRFLFEPNTVTTHRRIEEAVVQSLDRWEPRIEVNEVSVQPDGQDGQAALVTVRYTLVANRASDQMQLRVQLGA
jgi:phage baseplate assembly protein W